MRLKHFSKVSILLALFTFVSLYLSQTFSANQFLNPSNIEPDPTVRWCGDFSLVHQVHSQIRNSSDLWTWDRRQSIIDLAEFSWTKTSTLQELEQAWSHKKSHNLLVYFDHQAGKWIELYQQLPKYMRIVLLTPEGRNFGSLSTQIESFTKWGAIEENLQRVNEKKGKNFHTIEELVNSIEDERLVAWVVMQMPFMEHDKIISLPLGYMEWKGTLPLDEFFTITKPVDASKSCSMGLTYSNRPGTRETWTNFFNETFGPLYFPSFESLDFIEITRNCRFIPAPFGISPDTHRLWEALYSGTIPIVYTTPFDRSLHGLPIWIINSLDEVTPESLEQTFKDFTCKSWDFSRLTVSHWVKVVHTLAESGSQSILQLHPHQSRRVYLKKSLNDAVWPYLAHGK